MGQLYYNYFTNEDLRNLLKTIIKEIERKACKMKFYLLFSQSQLTLYKVFIKRLENSRILSAKIYCNRIVTKIELMYYVISLT